MAVAPVKYAIVTGAGSGLGRALALRLARAGYCQALVDIDEENAQATRRLVEQLGGAARVDCFDVADHAAWQATVERLKSEWPRLDLLVNNAGIAVSGEIGSVPLEAWRRALDTNLWGAIHGCQTCVPWLKQNPGSHVLNIASIVGLLPGPALGPYGVSKAGVVALSEALRLELARYEVGVTVACPGFFPTRLIETGLFAEPEQREFAEAITAAAKITADEVAAAAIKGVRHNRPFVVLPARARRLWLFKRWLPETFLRYMARRFRNGIKAP